jgi:Protein of unknown function (DUF2934)
MALRRPPESPRSAPTVSKRRAPTRAASPQNSSRAAAAPNIAVSPEVRRQMIAEAAYLRSEQRGFAPGFETEDWLLAEAEVDALLFAKPGDAPQ